MAWETGPVLMTTSPSNSLKLTSDLMLLATLANYTVRLQPSVKRRPVSSTICTCR